MNFKDFYNLNEAFDKPYEFDIDSSKRALTVYNFNVDDVDDPYSIKAVFNTEDTLDEFIQQKRDSDGRSLQDQQQAVQSADQDIASKYPNASKLASVNVAEYVFSDKGTGNVSKTGKGGHSATRVFGTIIHILKHYISAEDPKVILFTGAKSENRGPIYSKLTFRLLKSTPMSGYSYYVDDSDRSNIRFWIYKKEDVPYLGDKEFHQLLINQWQQQNPGLDNVYENDMS
jgi:hypothetical protein|tara:strand:- start:599 stop:1285 length:687 start_codon:yes stop_codon:yes gene_type:complete